MKQYHHSHYKLNTNKLQYYNNNQNNQNKINVNNNITHIICLQTFQCMYRLGISKGYHGVLNCVDRQCQASDTLMNNWKAKLEEAVHPPECRQRATRPRPARRSLNLSAEWVTDNEDEATPDSNHAGKYTKCVCNKI